MKKFLAMLLAVLMLAAVAACGAEAPAAAPAEKPAAQQSAAAPDAPAAPADETPNFEGRSITMAFESSEVNDGFQAEVDAFCEKYGCEIEVELLSGDATEANNTLYLRAATGNLPDIFKITVGSIMSNLDPEANLVDLSGYAFMDNVLDGFKDAASGSNGEVWAIPTHTANVAGVFYNKNVLAELGLEIPTTWAEFLDTCKWIRENTDMDPVCDPYDGAAGKQITYLSSYFYIRQENPDFVDQYLAREINFHDSPALMRALNKMYTVNQLGYQNSDPLSTSLEDAALGLCEGTAAFVICRTNIMTNVETVAPECYNDIGFFPLPDESADARGCSVWMPQGWFLSQTCEDKELALAFMEFLTTSEATDAYCTAVIPTGAFMLKGIALPDNVSVAVQEAQEWASKASTPVMEYYLPFKGANLANILAMCGTGELTPDQAVEQIEADFQLSAEQAGIW